MSLASEIDEIIVLRADAQRFRWWFSKVPSNQKNEFMMRYLDGIREGWNLDQWRAELDVAMKDDSFVNPSKNT